MLIRLSRGLIYSLRNAICYRQPNYRPMRKLTARQRGDTIEAARHRLTAAYAATAGLRIDGQPLDYVYLTRYQRQVRLSVSSHGYAVGL